MSQIYTTEIPVRNLFGVEDAGLVTESRSIPAGQGILKAGCLLQIDGNRALDQSTGVTTAGNLHSVLAFDTDTGVSGTTGAIPVTTYMAGSFLRHTIESASGFRLTDEQIEGLRSLGIFLERSVG